MPTPLGTNDINRIVNEYLKPGLEEGFALPNDLFRRLSKLRKKRSRIVRRYFRIHTRLEQTWNVLRHGIYYYLDD